MIRFEPKCEALHDRIVPSCTWVESNGVLTITGSQQANVIEIVDDGTALAITCDGESIDVSDTVTEVVICAGNGNDSVSYSLTGDLAAGTARTFDIRLGNGQDTFTGEVAGNLLDGSSLDLAVRGKNGKDTLDISVNGDVGAGSTLSVFLSGGNGMDQIESSYAGILLGELTWDIAGCNGRDNLGANLTFEAGSTGTADVEILGHNAPDTIALLVTDNSGDDGDSLTDDLSTLGDSTFAVNGGRSRDRLDVSDIVEVLDTGRP